VVDVLDKHIIENINIKGEVPKWNKFETMIIVVHGQLWH
jgi:hypothetical protein